MLPTALPSLLPPTLGAAGVVTPAGSTGINFASLLPAGVVPIMPRQRDGEGGNILPAEPGKADEKGELAGPNIWATPPLWLVTCPPPTHAGSGEVPLNPLPRFVVPLDVSASSPEIVPPADVSAGIGPVAAADPHHKTATEAPGTPTRIDRAEAGGEVPQATLPSVAPQELGTVSFPAPSPDGFGAALDGEPGEVAQGSAADPVATPPRQDLGVTVSIASLPQTSPASPAEGRRGIDPFPAPPFGAFVADVATPQLPQAASTLRTGEGSTPLPHVAPPSPDVPSPALDASTQAPPQPVAEDAAAKVPFDLPGQDRLPKQAVSARTDRIATPLAVEPDLDLPLVSPVAARAGTLLPPAPPAPAAQVAPASQIFAAAIHRAVLDEGQLDTPASLIAGIAPAAAELGASAVATIDGSRHGALDLGRETWPAKMIERIEMMRDAMDVVDTSIRLVPDKLGAIDVSLRKDGDAIAVHFTAQQAETRQLLADAQPKLAELAQEKGLKLATQAGNDPGSQHHQQQQRAPAPAALSTHRQGRPASHGDAAAADERIA